MFLVRKKRKKMTRLWCCVVAATFFLTFAACGKVQDKRVKSVSIGTEVETKQLSERDGKPYPVSYKITHVDRDNKSVKERIENYNLIARGSTISQISGKKLEYAIADYEVYYPKGFPDGEFGITRVALNFSIVGTDGKREIKVGDVVYKGLDKTWEIGDPPMGYDFYAEQTYKGSFVFLMVKRERNYAFKESYKENGKTINHYIKGQ